MSDEIGLEESNIYNSWLEKSVTDGYLNYYEYSDFKNIQQIGRGLFQAFSRSGCTAEVAAPHTAIIID